jgi:TRAP-type C4-dicarboxylate transport system permease small subunit
LSDSPRVSWLERAGSVGRRLEDALLVSGLGALILLASSQILLRNVFSVGVAWGDGLLRLIVLWLAVVGAVAASRDQRHIAIDVADRLLPPQLKRAVAVARCLFTSAVCAIFAWYAYRFVRDSHEFGDVLLGDWPAWWFQVVLPAGFVLIAYRYLLRAAAAALRAS